LDVIHHICSFRELAPYKTVSSTYSTIAN